MLIIRNIGMGFRNKGRIRHHHAELVGEYGYGVVESGYGMVI